MKRWIIALSVLAVFSGSCKKDDIASDTSGCLQKKISAFDQEGYCDDRRVDEYLFQGKTVYTFEPGTCGNDMATEVIDTDCKTLGFLGGFAGNGRIEGADFSSATFVRNVWTK